MAFSFETHALPVMLTLLDSDGHGELSEIVERVLPLAHEVDRRRTCQLLVQSGYVEGVSVAELAFADDDLLNPRLTVAAMRQLDLWPSDDERALYLVKRMSEVFEQMAVELASSGADAEEVSRLRAAGKAMVQFGGAVFAQVLATKITGTPHAAS